MMKGKQDVLLLHGFNKQETLISSENLSQATISNFLQRGCFLWKSKCLTKNSWTREAKTGCQREHFITAIG